MTFLKICVPPKQRDKKTTKDQMVTTGVVSRRNTVTGIDKSSYILRICYIYFMLYILYVIQYMSYVFMKYVETWLAP